MFYQGNYHRRNQYGTNNRDLTGRIAVLKQLNARLHKRYIELGNRIFSIHCHINQFPCAPLRTMASCLVRNVVELETLKRNIRRDISANDLERERTQERHEFELTGKFGGCGPRILTYRYTVVRSKRSPWRERERLARERPGWDGDPVMSEKDEELETDAFGNWIEFIVADVREVEHGICISFRRVNPDGSIPTGSPDPWGQPFNRIEIP